MQVQESGFVGIGNAEDIKVGVDNLIKNPGRIMVIAENFGLEPLDRLDGTREVSQVYVA